MIRIVCIHVSLSEIKELRAISEYEKMVRPIGYEFSLIRGAIYIVLGIQTRRGTPWLYVVAADGDNELMVAPAVLFAIDWSEVPDGWHLRLAGSDNIELLPASLAMIDHWFEKYIDEVPEVVECVNREIARSRCMR